MHPDQIKMSVFFDNTREILAKGWCQFNSAQDENGTRTNMCGPDAARHCLDGALYTAAFNESERLSEMGATEPEIYAAMNLYHDGRAAVEAHLGMNGVVAFNDTPGRTAADVINVVVQCAEKAREAERLGV